MPAQPVHRPRALGDKLASVIAEETDLHRPLNQIRDREPLDTVTYDRSRDRERIDLVRLPRLALALPGATHPTRRHPDDPLTDGQQRPLKAPGHMPAIVDRPHPVLIHATSPPNRRQMPRIISLDLPASAHPAGPHIHRRQRMRAPCVSAPTTII